ncbi:unnamed protein product [Trichogramma brassicae]|uniref:Uncharacterized protein n=1 Tax=Trichogramma brassicae TaxID=86971 RepID=A0A6H5IT19_9HYME|nr:unnamed protein product [Trichogramma brassicae]
MSSTPPHDDDDANSIDPINITLFALLREKRTSRRHPRCAVCCSTARKRDYFRVVERRKKERKREIERELRSRVPALFARGINLTHATLYFSHYIRMATRIATAVRSSFRCFARNGHVLLRHCCARSVAAPQGELFRGTVGAGARKEEREVHNVVDYRNVRAPLCKLAMQCSARPTWQPFQSSNARPPLEVSVRRISLIYM